MAVPSNLIPIVVAIPVLVLAGAVTIPVMEGLELEIMEISGFLQALVVGPFSIRLRSGGGALGILSWAGAGTQTISPPLVSKISGQIDFDVTAVGLGASGCTVVIWCSTGVERGE